MSMCKCGVRPHLRTVRKPGPSLGRQFLSCGNWKASGSGAGGGFGGAANGGEQCDFFQWQE